MTAYVDAPVWPWKGKLWCHLTADTLEELHAFAQEIGLKREWFQEPPKSKYPHYDMIEWRQKVALTKGAQLIDVRELVVKAKALLVQHEAIPKANGNLLAY